MAKKSPFSKFWDKEESLTVFLWMLLLFLFVFGPLSVLHARLKILLELSFGAVLITGIWASIESRRSAAIASFLAIFALVSLLAKNLLPTLELELYSEICESMALGLFLVVVLEQTMKQGPITGHRVKGALASYLLIAMLWAKFYNLCELLIPGAFNGVSHEDRFNSLLYFSFITLTTLGYGDITPAIVLTRVLTSAEALIGQLFPAVFIARLVSLEVEHRRR